MKQASQKSSILIFPSSSSDSSSSTFHLACLLWICWMILSFEVVNVWWALSVPTAWIMAAVFAFCSFCATNASLCCWVWNSVTVLNNCTTPLVAIIYSSRSWSSSSTVGMCLPINLSRSFSARFCLNSDSRFYSSVTSLAGRLYLARMGYSILSSSIFLFRMLVKARAKEFLRTPPLWYTGLPLKNLGCLGILSLSESAPWSSSSSSAV